MANSKSAYSSAGKKQKLDTHIIVVWVDNEAGVFVLTVIASVTYWAGVWTFPTFSHDLHMGGDGMSRTALL